MSDYGGFILCCTDEDRCDELTKTLQKEGRCSEVFIDSALPPKVIEIGFLSLREKTTHLEYISHIALVRRRTESVASGLYRIEFLKCAILQPINLKDFENATSSQTNLYWIQNYNNKGMRVPTEIWARWISYVKAQQPWNADAIDTLEAIRQPPKLTLPEGTSRSFALQWDAFGLAFEMTGIDRNTILPLFHSATSQPAEFLEGFANHYIPEEKAIAYDVRIPLPGWSEFRRDVKGAVEFRNGDEAITIVNAHQGPVEHTTGVDLVYYHQQHHAFIMVQYKTMSKNEGEKEFGYRPTDPNYQSEMERMQQIHTLARYIEPRMHDTTLTYQNYRLNSDIFYFKICDALMFERSPELVDGLYFPLELWQQVLESEEGKGKLGGLRIMRSKVKRYFNNTLFLDLAQKGWIGSRCLVSDALGILMKASLHSIEAQRLVLWAKSRKIADDERFRVKENETSAPSPQSIFFLE
jgi:hypothetical protein